MFWCLRHFVPRPKPARFSPGQRGWRKCTNLTCGTPLNFSRKHGPASPPGTSPDALSKPTRFRRRWRLSSPSKTRINPVPDRRAWVEDFHGTVNPFSTSVHNAQQQGPRIEDVELCELLT